MNKGEITKKKKHKSLNIQRGNEIVVRKLKD
jgi:hypothetical protein